MFDYLRTWWAQRGQTSSFPPKDVPFPERFRGRPSVRSGLPVLDLGTCLFSPEEAVEKGRHTTGYTRDFRLASTTRDGLLTDAVETDRVRSLDEKMRKLLGRSLRLRSVAAGSCNGCEAELVALGNVVFDMARFGIQFVASPRHADGIVVTGIVNENMIDALEHTYAAVPDPRIVIAVGACAAGGGPFQGSSALRGIPESIPVDLWIPGCPPHPLTVLDGLLRLLGRVEGEGRHERVASAADAE